MINAEEKIKKAVRFIRRADKKECLRNANGVAKVLLEILNIISPME